MSNAKRDRLILALVGTVIMIGKIVLLYLVEPQNQRGIALTNALQQLEGLANEPEGPEPMIGGKGAAE
jgi:type II secretory pathway component PulM